MTRMDGTLGWLVVVLRWTARLGGLAAALILSAFFLEHLRWFVRGEATPPPSVFVAQGFHLLAIVGLIAAWRWEGRGALLALTAGAGFVLAAGGTLRMAAVIAVLLSPAALWLIVATLARMTRRPAAARLPG
jgi:hypothetical protein